MRAYNYENQGQQLSANVVVNEDGRLIIKRLADGFDFCWKSGDEYTITDTNETPFGNVINDIVETYGVEEIEDMTEGSADSEFTLPAKGTMHEQKYVLNLGTITPSVENYA